MFDPDASVTKFIQKTAIQFKIKDTNYVLELARFEEFRCSDQEVTGWTPPVVRWGATLLNPDWEELLRNKEKRKAGVEMDMFLPGYQSGEQDSPALQEFLEVIRKVADLLGPIPRPGEDLAPEGESFTKGVLDAEFGTLF